MSTTSKGYSCEQNPRRTSDDTFNIDIFLEICSSIFLETSENLGGKFADSDFIIIMADKSQKRLMEESLKCPTKVKISKKIPNFFLLETSLVFLGASPDILGKIS